MHNLFIKIALKFCRQINSMSQTATKLSAIGVKTFIMVNCTSVLNLTEIHSLVFKSETNKHRPSYGFSIGID